ncbi:hypothetical protein [Parvularcula bermudensis]|nr:hypothetical protein [Parvularcula bermudensis]
MANQHRLFRLSEMSSDDAEKLSWDSPASARIRSTLSPHIGSSADKAPLDEPLRVAIITLDDACMVLDGVRAQLRDIAEPVIAAAADPDPANRALFADEYDEHRERFHSFRLDDQDPAAAILGESSTAMSIDLPNGTAYRVGRFSLGQQAELTLPPPVTAFADHGEIAEILGAIDAAFSVLDGALVRYRQDSRFLSARFSLPTKDDDAPPPVA